MSTEYEDLEATVVAAQNQKKEYQTGLVLVFFSMVIVLPLLSLVFMWVSIRGAIPYLRSYINDSNNFSSIASFYWIGQTVTIFVITMDIISLFKSSDLVQNERLEPYQVGILIAMIVIEGLGFVITLAMLLLSLCSHVKNTTLKQHFENFFEGLIKYILFCGVVSFKGIERKEARVWIVLSGLVTPIIALSSHAGFVVGGWVSYEDRSVAIVLMFLFSLVFLYWTFQFMYKSLNASANYTRRKKWYFQRPVEHDVEMGAVYNFERQLYTTGVLSNFFGFDTIALFSMIFPTLLVYGFIVYVGFGFLVPLIAIIDEALVHIYKVGNFVFVIIAFLLTYKVLTARGGGSGAMHLISNDALKYWKFLEKKNARGNSVTTLRQAIECLHLTLNAIPMGEIDRFSELLKRKCFELGKVKEHLNKTVCLFGRATDQGNRNYTLCPISSESVTGVVTAAERMNACFKDVKETFDLRNCLDGVEDWITLIKEEEEEERMRQRDGLNKHEKAKVEKAIKEFTAGVILLRNTLVRVLGIPPIYYNKDKANALVGALVYERVNSLRRAEEQNQRQCSAAVGQDQGPHGAGGQNQGPKGVAGGQNQGPHGAGGQNQGPYGAAGGQNEERPHGAGVIKQNASYPIDPWRNKRYPLLLSLIEEEF